MEVAVVWLAVDVCDGKRMKAEFWYPRERIVSASREMSSSNCTFWTPSVSMREVKRPCKLLAR